MVWLMGLARCSILKMEQRTPHPGPLPIGFADSADAERGETVPASRRNGDGKLLDGSRIFMTPASGCSFSPQGEGQDEGEVHLIFFGIF
jgi:hypothetical protein